MLDRCLTALIVSLEVHPLKILYHIVCTNYAYYDIFNMEVMKMAVALKDVRIDLRANIQQKSTLEKAAELKHISLSSYILSTSLKQAQIDLTKNDTLVLSNRDRDLIMMALDNPPEPNDALKKLFQ